MAGKANPNARFEPGRPGARNPVHSGLRGHSSTPRHPAADEGAQVLGVEGLVEARVVTRSRNSRARTVKAPPVRKMIRLASSGWQVGELGVEVHAAHLRHHHVAQDGVEALAFAQPGERAAGRW